jgi:DNA-binding MarR family transcriptional regulator
MPDIVVDAAATTCADPSSFVQELASATSQDTAPAVTAADSVEMPVSAVRVLRRFRMVFNAVKSHFQQVEKKAGIGGAQVWALSVIRDQPDIGVGGLAEAMDIHQSTASNLVKALLQAGFVEAVRGTRDRRAVLLRLLPPGHDVLARVPGPFAGVLPDALARLDTATLRRLDEDLGRLIAMLQVDERAAGIPLAQL